jgi:glycosyltransferase involved in cell wall biosynthesis
MASRLSIVVPLFNEEESVKKLVANIRAGTDELEMDKEIILVDDGSTDNTWGVIEKLKLTVPELKGIKLRRNCGQTSAMVAGFDASSGEIIVTMDGDLQNDATDIPVLLKKIEEGFDIVSGWRKDRKDQGSRVALSHIANSIISITTGVRLHDYGCSLKAYRAECIRSLKAYAEMHRFFPAMVSMTGATVAEIPVKHHPRRFGKSKYGFERVLKVFSDIIGINLIMRFSSKPLQGFILCSIPFFLLFLMFLVLSGAAGVFEWSAGKGLFFLLAAALCGLASVNLFALGTLGELIVSTSNLEHTDLSAITIRQFEVGSDGQHSVS